jgi:hypothetical protein
VSEQNDSYDASIPLLDDVLVQGNPVHARVGRGESEARTAPAAADVPVAQPLREPAVFMPGEAEFASGSVAERYIAPPDLSAHPVTTTAGAHGLDHDHDADVLAERLRGRFATYLTGEGRNLIEARCRDAFQDHTTWLVNQITREVAMALETEMLMWVREAIREELKKPRPRGKAKT